MELRKLCESGTKRSFTTIDCWNWYRIMFVAENLVNLLCNDNRRMTRQRVDIKLARRRNQSERRHKQINKVHRIGQKTIVRGSSHQQWEPTDHFQCRALYVAKVHVSKKRNRRWKSCSLCLWMQLFFALCFLFHRKYTRSDHYKIYVEFLNLNFVLKFTSATKKPTASMN